MYIIYRTEEGKKYIEQIVKDKTEATKAEASGKHYTHWTINASGEFPKLSSSHFDTETMTHVVDLVEFVDSRSYAEIRQSAYEMEFDEEWAALEGQRLDGTYTRDQVDDEMRMKRVVIKARIPKE